MKTFALAIGIGITVGLVAMVFLGAPLQPCFPGVATTPAEAAAATAVCDAARPAWLATLGPIERFEVEHRDLIAPLAILAGPVAGFLAYGLGTLVAAHRRPSAPAPG